MNISKITGYEVKPVLYKKTECKPHLSFKGAGDSFAGQSRIWIKTLLELSSKNLPYDDFAKFNRLKGVLDYIKTNRNYFERMLNYEGLDIYAKGNVERFVRDQIRLGEGIKRNKTFQTDKDNFVEHAFQKAADVYNSLFKSKKEIERESAKLYQTEGINHFLETNLENFKAYYDEIMGLVKEYPTGFSPAEAPEVLGRSAHTPLVKPCWKEYRELKEIKDKLYAEYTKLSNGEERNKIWIEINKAAKKLNELKERAKTENFSLLEKKDLSSATEKERWNYFENYAIPLMRNNEATAFDGLDMFEKYGMRIYIYPPETKLMNTSLGEFMTALPKNPSAKLLDRMFDVIDKFIVPNKGNDFMDAYSLNYIVTDREDFHIYNSMTEDLLIKAVNLLKKTTFWDTNYRQNIVFDLQINYLENKFKDSPRLKELKDALDSLEKLAEKK